MPITISALAISESRWQRLEQLVQLSRFHGRNVGGNGFDAIAQIRQ
ncbi:MULTISPECIES: hypothetical protein [unclassified Mesorhizobium]|nr:MULTISPECIES: hypothetical protein [unclassified Mesorhizobium]ESY14065.1 hypothetical protein X751_28900 [Mesorhizobium sp. LNJC395A00]WJI76381.1 hypothetical protein NLY37_06635 [Mesorhizobium sp. C395A]